MNICLFLFPASAPQLVFTVLSGYGTYKRYFATNWNECPVKYWVWVLSLKCMSLSVCSMPFKCVINIK